MTDSPSSPRGRRREVETGSTRHRPPSTNSWPPGCGPRVREETRGMCSSSNWWRPECGGQDPLLKGVEHLGSHPYPKQTASFGSVPPTEARRLQRRQHVFHFQRADASGQISGGKVSILYLDVLKDVRRHLRREKAH